MQLICPECGEQIAAENINIQKMVAVCSACDTVFQFDPPESKAKRRKVKQPQQLILRAADNLHMSFRTNFRLDKNEAFGSSAAGSIIFTLVALLLSGRYFAGNIPILVPVAFSLLALSFYYWFALTVFNKTHIDMDDEAISVSRKPIPSLFSQDHVVTLSGIVAIRCEETPISKREGYDTPRYGVWAEMADSTRKIIVTDVTEGYAYFIAQRLEEGFNTDRDLDTSRLEDFEQDSEYEESVNGAIQEAQE